MTETELKMMAELKKLNTFSGVYHVTTFKCYRDTPRQEGQCVTVEVTDRGPDSEPNIRYHCTARTDDGRGASGNPAETLEVAIGLVHWADLDKSADSAGRR